MKNLVIEAESLCTELSDSVKKARCIADTLFNEFYSLSELETTEEKNQILYGYKFACIEHDIINDYLVKMEQAICALSNTVDKMPLDSAYVKEVIHYDTTTNENNQRGGGRNKAD